jgi:hypothetical protein
MNFLRNLFAAAGIVLSMLASVSIALAAPATVNDQYPAPVPSTSNTINGQSEVLVQSYSISGGLMYQSCFKSPGPNPGYECSGLTFVPTNLSGTLTRYLDLSDARLDSGIISTSATGSTTAFGIARTAGTSYDLIGAATSSSAVTTKALWETNIASTYVSGTVIPVILNANYTGSGTLTGASTTLTVNAYTEVGGVETAITGITAAQAFTGTATNYTFNIPTTAGLVAGQHIAVEVVMLVTSSSGANTGQINSIGLTM